MIGREPRFRSPKDIFSVLGMGALLIVAVLAVYHVVLVPTTDFAMAVAEDPSGVTKDPSLNELREKEPSAAMSAALDRLIRNAESRTLEIKNMASELVRYVRIMVVVLIVIAVGFPLAMWLMSRRRLLGLSGLSSEVTATLVLVEERQAKLANVLKDIQNEIDYVHSMSVPDLKNLIQQAEAYLKQNEKDLDEVGSGSRRRDAS